MKRRSGIRIMLGLIELLLPMLHIMLACICLGVLGFFCAIFITVLAAKLLLFSMGPEGFGHSFLTTALFMVGLSFARALFRYGEQTCGHYIAFKLLAMIRDRIFFALRRLAPAKLEGKERGSLISILTGDIELLEVFYAHTIAPVGIALIVSLVMSFLIGTYHPALGVFALISYGLVGVVLPLALAGEGRSYGMEARSRIGGLQNVFLESLRGIREIRQFGQEEKRGEEIRKQTGELHSMQLGIRGHEAKASSLSGGLVMGLPLLMAGLCLYLGVGLPETLMAVVMLSSSFGPVLALSNLSSAMDTTLAAGERVLSLLEEEPETEAVTDGIDPSFEGAEVKDLSFSYQGAKKMGRGEKGVEQEGKVLSQLSISFPKGEIISVNGKSGSGKSTLLKLLMRFWRVEEDRILISGEDISRINSSHLRSLEGFVTQETDLFAISLRENIRLGRPAASQEEVEEAAKKASIHDLILTLPDGYDTCAGELGERFSTGERQRLGLARAFLYDAPFMLLDEPTSNLDSLNEGIILKALKEEAEQSGRTLALVSHRASTRAIADRAVSIENGRVS